MPNEHNDRLVRHRERQRIRIQNEDAEQREARLLQQRNYIRQRREEESAREYQRRHAESHRLQMAENQRRYNVLQTTRVHALGIDSMPTEPHYCGPLQLSCNSCGSLGFVAMDEKVYCCSNGKIQLAELMEMPPLIKELLTWEHNKSKEFHKSIRNYNSALAFASLGANIEQFHGSGPYCFKIHGQIYHRVGSIGPTEGVPPTYGQLYIMDSDSAMRDRQENSQNADCDFQLMSELDAIIRQVNPYAQAYKMMGEVYRQAELSNEHANVRMFIHTDRTQDMRRYNVACSNEVALIFTDPNGEPPTDRNICIHGRSGDLQHIDVTNPNCDPMTYPLLFPFGDQGWSVLLERDNPSSRRTRITMLEFYAYRLAIRINQNTNAIKINPLLCAGKLTQQYIVDAYAKVEGNNLKWIKHNQKTLRAELYQGLIEYITQRSSEQGLPSGKMVILPSSFQGSIRALQQNYQDAMSLVRCHGKPDLFITFTCNPGWIEIQENLYAHQTASDRPDLVARVFHLKLHEFLKDVTKRHVFGRAKAWTYTIEFQKRGLPHCHMLLILEEKIDTIEQIDKIISAEIPDPTTNPYLHDLVMNHMIHGPCGPDRPSMPCMQVQSDSESPKCRKCFPKEFCDATCLNENGYPQYMRRYTGKSYNHPKRPNISVDNSWVVPYNPYLLAKYAAHINVENCQGISSIKYIYKYIHKGYDCASVGLSPIDNRSLNWDEIQTYLDSRYISAPEGMWRLNKCEMHANSHTIIRLPVHLPFQQRLQYIAGQEEEAIERATRDGTMLTAWFNLNATDEKARSYTYTEIPYHYKYDKEGAENRKKWIGRKNKIKIITRMYNARPQEGERFYLRLLLLHAKGATSYDDLVHVNGKHCTTFKDAAKESGLVIDNREWEFALEEAANYQMPSQLRQMFAFICVFNELYDPLSLWNKFKQDMCEDYVRQMQIALAENAALIDINEILEANNMSCRTIGLPIPDPNLQFSDKTIDFDIEQEQHEALSNYEKLNSEQHQIANTIIGLLQNPTTNNKCHSIDGPGGTGKTFLLNTLISILRSKNLPVVTVAWTGIASLLLKGARTVHSTFKLPLNLDPDSTSNLRPGSRETNALREAKVLIWDEIGMTHTYAFTAVDKLLKEVRQNNEPFGGIIVVAAGDFRQLLPVVKRASKAQIISKCVKKNPLWAKFTFHKLIQNMRVSPAERDWATYLLRLGNGETMNDDNLGDDIVHIRPACIAKTDIIDEIYGAHISQEELPKVHKKAILCPKNDDTLKINDNVINRIEGEKAACISTDTLNLDDDHDDLRDFPIECLHKLTESGMPPHELNIKKGAIIMLLRNMCPKDGLCNGTRLQIDNILSRSIHAHIITGNHKGKQIFLPRINLTPSDTHIPYTRRQFPVRVAFSMTISKSQGQSLDHVGIYLRVPVFSHGQLYVALSRCTSENGIKMYIQNTSRQGNLTGNEQTFTINTVYKEVLQDEIA